MTIMVVSGPSAPTATNRARTTVCVIACRHRTLYRYSLSSLVIAVAGEECQPCRRASALCWCRCYNRFTSTARGGDSLVVYSNMWEWSAAARTYIYYTHTHEISRVYYVLYIRSVHIVRIGNLETMHELCMHTFLMRALPIIWKRTRAKIKIYYNIYYILYIVLSCVHMSSISP